MMETTFDDDDGPMYSLSPKGKLTLDLTRSLNLPYDSASDLSDAIAKYVDEMLLQSMIPPLEQ